MKKKLITSLIALSTLLSSSFALSNATSVYAAVTNPDSGIGETTPFCSANPNYDNTSYSFSSIENLNVNYLVGEKTKNEIISIIKSKRAIFVSTRRYCTSSSSSVIEETETIYHSLENATIENTTYDMSKTGNYPFRILFTYNGATISTTIQIYLEALDNTKPVISGWSGVYYTSDISPVTTEQILALLSAVDETDGEVNVYVKEDAYSGNGNVIGEYPIVFGAVDAAGNEATITITVAVVDVTKPTITGGKTVLSNMSSPLTVDSIKRALTATDMQDGTITDKIVVVEDNFTGHEQEKGSYTISFQVTDEAGNTSELFVVTVSVKDDIIPLLISSADEIRVSTQGIVTESYVKSLLYAVDNADGDVTSSIRLIENTYTANRTKAGTYKMTFEALDGMGNSSEIFTMNIVVFDNIAPVFYISDYFIGTEVELNQQQIVDLIATMNGINTANYDYEIDMVNYQNNAQTPGTYEVTAKFYKENGEVEVFSVDIEVIDPTEESENKPIEAKEPWYEKAWTQIKRGFKLVKNWFKKLFK